MAFFYVHDIYRFKVTHSLLKTSQWDNKFGGILGCGSGNLTHVYNGYQLYSGKMPFTFGVYSNKWLGDHLVDSALETLQSSQPKVLEKLKMLLLKRISLLFKLLRTKQKCTKYYEKRKCSV